jgi:hypothetical protein
MIDAVSSISPASALDYARKAAAAREVFQIPESALRTNGVSPAQGVAERDPVVDSVELSRDFPQLFVGAAYAPPPVEQTPGLRRGGARGVGGEEDAASGYPGSEELSADAEDPEGEGVDEAAAPGEAKSASGEKLDEAEQKQVNELKARDREVRAHEQAHKAVGGSYAGGISYEYQQGPDGNKYAVGGEVSIDVSPEKEPEATIAKMQQVKAAAMAPAEPSGQDRTVAAEASQNETQARQTMAEQRVAESAEGSGETGEAPEETGGVGSADGADRSGDAAARPGGPAGSASANPFISRYAENAYGAQSFPAAARGGYMPINIVA